MENVADIYPLSPSQEGMLFHTLAEPEVGVYVMQYVATLRGTLDEPLFRKAWDQALSRHAVLRTAFFWEGLDEPLQVVREEVILPWTAHDWSDGDAASQQRRLDEWLREDRARTFDPAQAPLMRMALIRTGAETYRFVWSCHHLLLDGWSRALLVNEVFADYAAHVHGREPALAVPPPFKRYIAWLTGQNLASAEAHWKETLRGFDTPTPLAIDQPAERGTRVPHARSEVELSVDATDRLVAFVRYHRLTLNTLLQGAWAVLLSRYSGERDVVHGTAVSGRPAALPGVASMVGMFINTLPVRATVAPGDTVVPWLRALQEHLLAAQAYEYTPLARLQKWSEVQGGRALFESIVVFENHPPDAVPPEADLGFRIEDERYYEQSNYPLALLGMPGPALRLVAIYDTARFDDAAITQLLGHLSTLLQGLVEQPEAGLDALPMLSDPERAELLAVGVGDERSALPEGGVLGLIERHARDAPNAPAVAFGDGGLTYGQLWDRAGRLAGHLRGLGVSPNVPVGVCVARSPELIVGILGILRAGGAYIPLDPKYPAERLQFMLGDAEAPVLVTQKQHRGLFADSAAHIVDLDDIQDAAAPLDTPDTEDLVYIIYTSGSTGQPKGVGVMHGNLAHSTQARLDYYDDPVRGFLLLSSVAFDSSVAGIFWTLASGGTLVLPPERLEQDVPALTALIAQHGVTHTLCLPSLWRVILDLAVPEHLASLRCVIAAGEALPPELAEFHYDRLPEAALYNEYGPTEATVWATVHHVEPKEKGQRVPIGRPIPGARAYVLDARGGLAPFGVPGELYLGGDGITPGYVRRPDRTQEAFVLASFGLSEGRLYRTGDRVRWLPDGTLDFLGRVDHQVKVRGHRIELGEVEAALRQHTGVRDAAAIVYNAASQSDATSSDPDDIAALASRLEALGSDQAEHLLAEIGEGAPATIDLAASHSLARSAS